MEENDRILEDYGFEVVRGGAGVKPFFKTPKPHRRRLYKLVEVSRVLGG